MESDAEITIAFIFKRSGKQKLKLSEFYLPLSMQLNWFSLQEAKEFVKIAIKQKLLEEKDGLIKPNFDIKQVTIPVGFYPSRKLFNTEDEKTEKKEEEVLRKIIRRIVEKTDLNEKKAIEKIKEMEKTKNITPEVAALLVGKDYDVPLEDFYEEINENIL